MLLNRCSLKVASFLTIITIHKKRMLQNSKRAPSFYTEFTTNPNIKSEALMYNLTILFSANLLVIHTQNPYPKQNNISYNQVDYSNYFAKQHYSGIGYHASV